ncbi:MAG: DUF1501 domain-containing protein [Limnobacter sp.]|nr:DUF1501 domain-containing protein [Limnobacter sp.]
MMNRRNFLTNCGIGIGVSLAGLPSFASAASDPNTPCFVFINLRGAADGVDMVRPVFDVGYQNLRSKAPNYLTGLDLPQASGGLPFKLNPYLSNIHALYNSGEALLFHAMGLNYSKAASGIRSHFASQQMLESMSDAPYLLKTGFIGRLMALRNYTGVAAKSTLPLVLESSKRRLALTWSPTTGAMPTEDLIQRVKAMYEEDRQFLSALNRGYQNALVSLPKPEAELDKAMKNLFSAISFANEKNIPFISIEIAGWDAHTDEWGLSSGYTNALKALDSTVALVKSTLQGRWAKSCVLVNSEFGRTAAINGSAGTDHGSGTIAMLLGGAVQGGRVVTKWPGMQENQLFEKRDLAITLDVQQLQASVLEKMFGLSPAEQELVFSRAMSIDPLLSGSRLFKG